MDRQFTPRSLGTHDGTFHADEVTACALLTLFNLIDIEKIVRSRDHHRLLRCEYVCDVGGTYEPSQKLFDHHQVHYQGSMSSAGMILKYLFETGIMDQSEYDTFNLTLIKGVDAHDNGKEPPAEGYCSFSNLISNFNPICREASENEVNEAFLQALQFTLGHLRRMRERHRYILSCREMVAEKMSVLSECLVFDHNIAWMESFFELGGDKHPAAFIVMPSSGHWKLRGIPPNYEQKMSVRVPLPKEWAGLLDEDLKRVSGISGAVFCHKGRFISVWETKEDALKALEYTLKMQKEHA